MTHVDDFLVSGTREELVWLRERIKESFEIKGKILGRQAGDDKEIEYLGRTIKLTEGGLTYEAGAKHVRKALEEMQMSDCKALTSPGSKEETKGIEEEALGKQESALYRRVGAILNYLSMDRPDISFSTKEVARKMSKPEVADWVRLKRILRFLRGHPRLVWHYPWQMEQTSMTVFTDSDWASCLKTRRSTSGGVVMIGSHLIHHSCRTQATIALSSCEAELNAALKAGSEAIGLRNVMAEMRDEMGIQMFGDSTASRGVLLREGAGRIKHLDIKQLWIQEKVADGTLAVEQIPRKLNIADALTHHWGGDVLEHHEKMGLSNHDWWR